MIAELEGRWWPVMKQKRRRFGPWILALALVAGLAYSFWPRPIEVEASRVHRGAMVVTVDEDGKTRLKQRYMVASALAGRMSRITLKPGDPLEAGKTLITVIEPSPPSLLDERAMAEAEARLGACAAAKSRAAADRERSAAALQITRDQLARTRRLYEQKSIPLQDFDLASHNQEMAVEQLHSTEFGEQVAHFEWELARAALASLRPRSPGDLPSQRLEIRSPINGRVLRVLQESETTVQPGMNLIELGDPSDLEVEVDLLSDDAVRVKPGASVSLEHWGGDRPIRGRVRLVEPSGFTKISALGVEEQRVNVIIDVTDPLDDRETLGDGYRVEAKVTLWETSDVLQVPIGALVRQPKGWAVFRVNDGRAILTPIQLGHTNGQTGEILEGLDQGDVILVHPGDLVANEREVVPRFEEP